MPIQSMVNVRATFIGVVLILTFVFPNTLHAQGLSACPFDLFSAFRYPTGDQPFDILTDDFDHDGINDLAIANVYSNDVTIYRGIGDGGFAQHIPLRAGKHPATLAFGDLNNDGFGDMLIGNVGGRTISAYNGSSTGAFTLIDPILPGGAPLSILIRDLTDDGIEDLLVADASFNRLYVMKGKGDGGYEEIERHEIGSLPFDLVLEDVTGDGRLDVIVLSFDGSSVEVIPGIFENGIFDESLQKSFVVSRRPPVFIQETNTTISPYPIDFVLADFDKDGLIDIATANYGTKEVGLLYGDRETIFKDPLSIAIGDFPSAIATGDMNGDGFLDLIVTSAGSNRIYVFLGEDNGSFGKNSFVYEVDFAPSAISVHDFDRDGRLDIGVTNFEESTLQIFLNRSEGGVGCFVSNKNERIDSGICGDGSLDRDEECDDANERSLDGCSAECLLEIGFCGDGTVQKLLNEQCEPSLHDSKLPYVCTENCRYLSSLCGNGQSNPGEECDDGVKNSDDPDSTCRLDCSLPRCGDGILDALEECDDFNRLSRDGCDAYCRLEFPLAEENSFAELSGSSGLLDRFPPGFEKYFGMNFSFPSNGTQAALVFPSLPSLPSQPDTGPAIVAVMAAGAGAGFAFMRRRRKA